MKKAAKKRIWSEFPPNIREAVIAELLRFRRDVLAQAYTQDLMYWAPTYRKSRGAFANEIVHAVRMLVIDPEPWRTVREQGCEGVVGHLLDLAEDLDKLANQRARQGLVVTRDLLRDLAEASAVAAIDLLTDWQSENQKPEGKE